MSSENDKYESKKELARSYFMGSDLFPYSANRNLDKYYNSNGDKYKFRETNKLYNIALCNGDYQLTDKIAYLLNIYTFSNEKLFTTKFKNLKCLGSKNKLPLSSQWLFEIKILQSIPEIKKQHPYVSLVEGILKHFNENEILLEDSTIIYGDLNTDYLEKVTKKLKKIYSCRLSKIEISKRKLKDYIDTYLSIADINSGGVDEESIDKNKLTNEIFILRELNIFSTLCHPKQAKRLKYLAALIYDYELLVFTHEIKFDEAIPMLAKKYSKSESAIRKSLNLFRYDKYVASPTKMKIRLK